MHQPDYTSTDEVVTRHSISFYMAIIFSFLAFGAIAGALLWLGFRDRSWGFGISGLLILPVIYYYVTRYYRIAPNVTVSQGGISCKGQFYSWQDVSSVQLTGSQPMKIFGGKEMEGTRVELKNGQEIILLMGMYTNLAEVRRFISNVKEEGRELNVTGRIDPSSTAAGVKRQEVNSPTQWDIDDIQYVRGNSVLNTNGLMTCFFLVIPVLVTLVVGFTGPVILFWVMFPSFGALLSMFINYFGVSGQQLIVRNAFRPWKRKVYPFADIRQIVFASNHNGNHILRIIFHNYSHKEIAAVGLRDTDWLQLAGYLRSLNIDVVDENDFVEKIKPETKKTSRMMTRSILGVMVVIIAGGMAVQNAEVGTTAKVFLAIGWLILSILLLLVVPLFIVRNR
jgi:hypothetical protein